MNSAAALFPEFQLDRSTLRRKLSEFQSLVLTRDPLDRGFISFDDGFVREQEWYKTEIRFFALKLLKLDEWSQKMIGSGKICDYVIDAIEKSDHFVDHPNNLLNWQGKQYGPKGREHLKIIEAKDSPTIRFDVENALHRLFLDANLDQAFDYFIRTVNRKYPLIAYLCWLRDDDLFMPISPRGFDVAFANLRIPVSTSRKCSYDNYRRYNGAIGHIAEALSDELSQDVRLVDAHSFCWMLARLPDKKPSGSIRDALDTRNEDDEEAVARRLAGSILSTSRQSGVRVSSVRKHKPLTIDADRLVQVLMKKLREQDWVCALTGLQIEKDHPQADSNMVASPDRIDSSGPYCEDNIQIVCRFANFWKSATPNHEFLRLLLKVRNR